MSIEIYYTTNMLKELIKNYEDFGDALITEFHYKSQYTETEFQSEIEIWISCFNAKNYNQEIIKITFESVQYFKIHDISRMVFCALLKEEEIITVDFFPIYFSEENLKEDPDSNFIVKCKSLKYSIVE